MPRHLISDAHEWSNGIPTVPMTGTANPRPRERAWHLTAGKEDPVELDSSMCEVTDGMTKRGGEKVQDHCFACSAVYVFSYVDAYGEFGWGGTTAIM